MVPTVDRGLRLADFWSMDTAGLSPSMKSTSGLSIWPRNCRAYADSDSTYRRCPSAKIVSNARLDFPDPDSPVNTISASRGKSSETSFRLCSRAPRTTRRSATVCSALRSLTSVFRGLGDASPWYPGGPTKRGASGCGEFRRGAGDHPDGNVLPGRRIPGAVPGRGDGRRPGLLAWLIGRDAGAALSVSSGPADTGQEPAAGRGGLPPKLPKWG